jgi:hypothetical protein
VLRKAWSALLFIVAAAVLIQVAAATIRPYLPTIALALTIFFLAVVGLAILFLIWKILRNRRRLL